MGELAARATSQAFLSHSAGEALGPLHLLAEGRTRFPGPMPAIGTLEAPSMQPQPDGMLQDGQVAHASRSALLHPGTARLTSGTPEVIVSAFEMQLQLLGAEHLSDDAEFGETESRCDPMEIHEHGFLLLAGLSRIVGGILCVSIPLSKPLAIGINNRPQ